MIYCEAFAGNKWSVSSSGLTGAGPQGVSYVCVLKSSDAVPLLYNTITYIYIDV